MKIQKYIKSKKELGENLKKARIKLGISQDIVAKLTNLSRSSISYSQFSLKKEDRARSREAKEEREKRRKDLRLAQNFSMGLRSGE